MNHIINHLLLLPTEPIYFLFVRISLPSAVKNKLTENLSKEFFKNSISFINSDYGNSRHVSYRCNLDAGRYLLMATTYEPGEESGKGNSNSFEIQMLIFVLFDFH